MKKLIILLTLILFVSPASAQFAATTEEPTFVIEGGVTFDWISKTQMQRDENIAQIRDILFTETTVLKYPKKEFKEKYAEFSKDKKHIENYKEIIEGKKEDAKAYYCAFNFGNSAMLIAYGVQYKNNMKNIYYYDAMGNLRWVDIFSEGYPKFPYQSHQYDVKGALVATYYFVSDADQYVYGPNKDFKGRWYKDKLYNRKAKVIMTRSNY